MKDDLDRGTYVAHSCFANGDDCDDRATRRCKRCGGVQYDWGGCGSNRRRLPYFMNWYCNGTGGCGLFEDERMSRARFYYLRGTPAPKVKRAPGAPWKRWRTMQANIERQKRAA